MTRITRKTVMTRMTEITEMTRMSGMTGVNRIDMMTTVWHKIFAGSNFCFFLIFPTISKNKLSQIKTTANIFPAKIYFRVNIL